jgi:transcriptional regulator with XRE-family HTH domain
MLTASSPIDSADSADVTEDADLLDERIRKETARGTSPDLLPVLASNLRRLRVRRGLSLERLAKQSSVSRAMLSQIELAYSAPTINVMWRIANALNVPFSALLETESAATTRVLPAARAKLLTSHDGAMVSRALFPFDAPRRTEFYQLELKPRALERAQAHPRGTTENLVVSRGEVAIHVGRGAQGGTEVTQLQEGDAILFVADVEHAYENRGDSSAILYLVMSYTHEIGG